MSKLARKFALVAACATLATMMVIGFEGTGKAGLGASSLVADVDSRALVSSLVVDFMIVDQRTGATLWVADRSSISAVDSGASVRFTVSLPSNAPTGSTVERVFRLNGTRLSESAHIDAFIYTDANSRSTWGTVPSADARGQIIEANQR